MNLFIKCENCDIPVLTTLETPICSLCKKPFKKIEAGFTDEYPNLLTEFKDKQYFEWEDIQRLIYIAEHLTALNTELSVELAKALMSLERTRDRLRWYQGITNIISIK